MRCMSRSKRIGFFLFDGVTALDLTGPAEAFACARLAPERGTPRPAYDVVTVGVSRRARRSSAITVAERMGMSSIEAK